MQIDLFISASMKSRITLPNAISAPRRCGTHSGHSCTQSCTFLVVLHLPHTSHNVLDIAHTSSQMHSYRLGMLSDRPMRRCRKIACHQS